MANPLHVLAITNMYPSHARPTHGIFVEQQIRGLRDIGLNVEVFCVDRAEGGMASYFRMLKPLRALVQRTKPAIVHVMYGGIMADRIARWNSGCPTIITFHGSDLLGENLSGIWRRWVSRYGVRCSWRAAHAAQGIVVVSERLRHALPSGLDAAKVRVIPCGIDLERFKPLDPSACRRQLGWSKNSFNVLFASNSSDPVKRPWLAFSTVDRLKFLGVPTELRYLHGVPNLDVPTWMSASDALLLTSAHEGSPMVVKEALACGLPVVSVDVGDVAERIKGIKSCRIALPTVDDLAAELLLVLQMRDRVQAHERIQELSLGNIALKLDRFYRETLQGGTEVGKSRVSPSRARVSDAGGDASLVSRNSIVG